MNIKRNILLNPGPATTTDTVKLAQIVPDICPREQEFAGLMKGLRRDLVRVVHGDERYTSVLFCGSGTINIDICLNSLLPAGKKILVANNGAYSSRGVVWRRIKKGANKVLKRDENAGKEVEDDIEITK